MTHEKFSRAFGVGLETLRTVPHADDFCARGDIGVFIEATETREPGLHIAGSGRQGAMRRDHRLSDANGIHKVGFGAVRREAAQDELFRFERAW
jgi:hypothetical protein